MKITGEQAITEMVNIIHSLDDIHDVVALYNEIVCPAQLVESQRLLESGWPYYLLETDKEQ